MALALNNLKLSTKILSLVGFVLVAFVAAVAVMFVNAYRHDAVAALSDKAGAFTAVADEAKTLASESMMAGAIDVETLLGEAIAAVEDGRSYKDTRFFNAIPVVVGWTTAERAANKEGIEFRVTAFDARNRDNEPSPGSFRHDMLSELESQIAMGGEPTLSRVNTETNMLHYMRAVGLNESCMSCHGDPAIYDTNGDGKDALGFVMEGWKVGDTHGAYEVIAPLSVVDDQVASFVGNAMFIIGPAFVIVFGFLIYAMRTMLVKPLKNLAESMKNISTGDGDLTKRIGTSRRRC